MPRNPPKDLDALLSGLLSSMPRGQMQAMPENLQAMVRKVCAQCGEEPPFMGMSNNMNGPIGAGTTTNQLFDAATPDHKKYGIIVGEQLFDSFGADSIGVLAHEVGHYHFRHPGELDKLYKSFGGSINNPEDMNPAQFTKVYEVCHQQEFAADQFAAQYGYGEELARCLQYDGDQRTDWNAVNADSWRHPATAERIRRIRQITKQKKVA